MTWQVTGAFPVGMGNVLSSEKQHEVRALGRLGWSLRRIERETGVRRETASVYLMAAGIPIRGPRRRRLEPGPAKPASQVTAVPGEGEGGPVPAESGGDPKPASQVTTDPEPLFSPRVSSCEAHRDFVEEGARSGRTAKAIWQDLVDDRGFSGSYECVKRFVRRVRGPVSLLSHPVILTEPGQEAQVDYGDGPMVRHPDTGKYRRTRLFAMTLGRSRKAVWLLTWRSSSRIWCELHERSFRRLGGATRLVVLDNLKEGVIQPDIYDPALNPLYRDLLAHYGAVALPARVRDPDRKGKVESSIGFAQKRLRGMRFESLEAAQAYVDRWCERWADTRIHGTTKRQVAAMFADEKPHLLPLPIEPFRFYQYGERVVHLDGCVEVEGAYYGAPPGWITAKVPVQWDDRVVRIMHPRTRQLWVEHPRRPRGTHCIRPEHRSPKSPKGIDHFLRQARNAGPNIGALCEEMYRREEDLAIRRILGVLSLVKRYGRTPVDHACELAIELGSFSYRVLPAGVSDALFPRW